ncbi:MAG: hypothetical protein HZB10_00120 [Candidatus Yonathbacteria bacterium]|nr:hypothetical protein [Candidatus Yonathbacteria bacterium]
MPQYRTINKDFFKKWSPEMAYVLGYIAADGAITIGKRGNHYLDIVSIDSALLHQVRRVLGSNHQISKRKRNSRWNVVNRLQIGNKKMVEDLIAIGIVPNKTKRLVMPWVPQSYFGDFLRGYFDGDGNVSYVRFSRRDRNGGIGQHMRILFTSSSEVMLKKLQEELEEILGIVGKLRKDKNWYRLYYYRKNDIATLYQFMYGHQPTLYLQRKFVYFKDALKKINNVGR